VASARRAHETELLHCVWSRRGSDAAMELSTFGSTRCRSWADGICAFGGLTRLPVPDELPRCSVEDRSYLVWTVESLLQQHPRLDGAGYGVSARDPRDEISVGGERRCVTHELVVPACCDIPVRVLRGGEILRGR